MFARALAICVLSSAALAACAAQEQETARSTPSAPVSASPLPAAEGVVRTGVTIAAMSDQYAHPRPVGTAATGASAWVGPVPEPAYVATAPLPPADPPPPPIAAVANRPPAAPATPNLDRAAGRALFNQWSCGVCHILADATASGGIGPALDGNAQLTQESVVRVITSGQGAMPAFGGQIADEDIAALAAYIMAAKK